MVIRDSDKFDKVNVAEVRTNPKMMQVEVGIIVWILIKVSLWKVVKFSQA